MPAQGRADLAGAALLLGERLEAAVVRQDEVGPVGEDEVRADLDTEPSQLVRLALERDRVHHHSVADHAQDPLVEDPGGDEVEDELPPAHDHGVARVVPAVVAGHHLDPRGQQVDDLPLAFVAPLGAGDHDVRHAYSSEGAGTTAEADGDVSASNV